LQDDEDDEDEELVDVQIGMKEACATGECKKIVDILSGMLPVFAPWSLLSLLDFCQLPIAKIVDILSGMLIPTAVLYPLT
jgi:hypothetical protein